jgi:uncharacterized membrane protein
MKNINLTLLLFFTVTLLAARVLITGELTYIFLGWNLFLAWIPFAISNKIEPAGNQWKIYFLLLLWLLFLPNAPYIITDFFHLKQRAPVSYWYDVLLLFSAALNGLLLGLASLLNVENFITTHYNKRVSGIIILCSLFLCAFGIYIGRYLRWNSWDVFLNPFDMAGDISERILNPFKHFKTWSVTLLFGIFLSVVYFSFKNLLTNKTTQY